MEFARQNIKLDRQTVSSAHRIDLQFDSIYMRFRLKFANWRQQMWREWTLRIQNRKSHNCRKRRDHRHQPSESGVVWHSNTRHTLVSSIHLVVPCLALIQLWNRRETVYVLSRSRILDRIDFRIYIFIICHQDSSVAAKIHNRHMLDWLIIFAFLSHWTTSLVAWEKQETHTVSPTIYFFWAIELKTQLQRTIEVSCAALGSDSVENDLVIQNCCRIGLAAYAVWAIVDWPE